MNVPFRFDAGEASDEYSKPGNIAECAQRLADQAALVERGRLGIRLIATGLSCLPTADLQEEALTLFLAKFDAGEPGPAWNDLEAEAEEWAAWASRRELRAYIVACFRYLPDADRRAFLRRAA